MADITSLSMQGPILIARFDNGSSQLFVNAGDLWIPGKVPDNGTGSEVGDNGGPGTSEDTDSPPTGSVAGLYNPWKSQAISVGGGWEDHIARTGRGGIDYPYGGGTAIKAPADGTLHISGGSGDYAAGSVGDAGKRSILYLDKTFPRLRARGRNEAAGPLRAIVFQHQSVFGDAKHYNKGDIVGYTGNTGNGVYHLHVHGLDKGGARVNFLNYFPG